MTTENKIDSTEFKKQLKFCKSKISEINKTKFLNDEEMKSLKEYINLEINNNNNSVTFLSYLVERIAEYGKKDDLIKKNKIN